MLEGNVSGLLMNVLFGLFGFIIRCMVNLDVWYCDFVSFLLVVLVMLILGIVVVV